MLRHLAQQHHCPVRCSYNHPTMTNRGSCSHVVKYPCVSFIVSARHYFINVSICWWTWAIIKNSCNKNCFPDGTCRMFRLVLANSTKKKLLLVNSKEWRPGTFVDKVTRLCAPFPLCSWFQTAPRVNLSDNINGRRAIWTSTVPSSTASVVTILHFQDLKEQYNVIIHFCCHDTSLHF